MHRLWPIRRVKPLELRLLVVLTLATAGAMLWAFRILQAEEFRDAFWYLSYPRLNSASAGGYIPEGSNALGWDALMILLIELSGLPVQQFAFLPITGPLLIVTGGILAWSLTKSIPVSAGVALYVFFGVTLTGNAYSTFFHGWGYLLAIVAFLLMWNLQSWPRAPVVLSLIFVYLSLNLVYYAIELWVLSTLASAAVLTWMSKARMVSSNAGASTPFARVGGVFPVAAVMFFAMNRALYHGFLPNADPSTLLGGFDVITATVNQLLGGNPGARHPLVAVGTSSRLRALTQIVKYVVLLAPLALLNPWLRRRIGIASPGVELTWLIVLGVGAAGPVAAYLFLGHLNLGPAFFMLPFATLPLLYKFGRSSPKTMSCYLAVLVIVSSAAAGQAAMAGEMTRGSTFSEAAPVVDWLLDSSGAGADDSAPRITSDLYVLSIVQGHASERRLPHEIVYLTPDQYLAAIDAGAGIVVGFDYILIDKASVSLPVVTYDWARLRPFGDHLHLLNENPQLTRVYEDQYFVVFKSRGA